MMKYRTAPTDADTTMVASELAMAFFSGIRNRHSVLEPQLCRPYPDQCAEDAHREPERREAQLVDILGLRLLSSGPGDGFSLCLPATTRIIASAIMNRRKSPKSTLIKSAGLRVAMMVPMTMPAIEPMFMIMTVLRCMSPLGRRQPLP